MGIDKIRDYKPYKNIPIAKDYSVADDEKVFIGNGIGCHTFWFKTVKDAKRFIDKHIDKIKVSEDSSITGLIPTEICKKCKCHYSYGSKEWEEYPSYACKELKRQLKKEAGIN